MPENQRNQPYMVTFVYEEGKPAVWNLRTPSHTGWKGANIKVLADEWPNVRPGKLKAVEFSAKAPGFQAVLDDIRFVPDGLDFQLHDEWVPQVTDGCFSPEYTLERRVS